MRADEKKNPCVCRLDMFYVGDLTKFMLSDARGFEMKRHSMNLKLNIAYGLARGYTQKEIGFSLGVHQSTISRHARRRDIAEMIRTEEEKVLREFEEQCLRAAQDPVLRAEAYELCRRAILKSIKQILP